MAASDNDNARAQNVRQAEELLDTTTARVGRFLERTVARAREEAADIWAEARSLSGQNR